MKDNILEAEISINIKFRDLDLVERLHSMADELDISFDDLVSMAAYRLLDDIYVIRRLWINKKPYLKKSDIFPQYDSKR